MSGVGIVTLAYLAVNDPVNSRYLPPCLFLAVTGLECPGCGSTRGVHQLLNGRIKNALELNILMVLALPWIMWRYILWMINRESKIPMVNHRILIAIGILVVAFGILRNIDVSFLRPLSTKY